MNRAISFEVAYDTFVHSDYLNSVWHASNGPCAFALDDRDYLILMAKVEKIHSEYKISCIKGNSYDPIELSDVRPEWWVCDEIPEGYDGLAKRVYDEIHSDPYPLVHLATPLPADSDVVYILIKNCHWLHELEVTEAYKAFCREDGMGDCYVKSAAYAVLDVSTGRIYWY